MPTINVIGAGLAGCESAYQLAKRGYKVNLYEMKPIKFSAAHKNPNFAELVCSNSLKSDLLNTACGLLKQELRQLDSLIIKCADLTKVPAGSALAVDRNKFSQLITDQIKQNKNINIINQEVNKIDTTKYTIIATGPLTSTPLQNALEQVIGDNYLHFFDAVAPIVIKDSIDFDRAFVADRYNKGNGDYINCEMDKEEYLNFYNALITAQTVPLKDFENNVYEGCMPVEVLAKRGEKSLLFGPLKPVGLIDPKTSKRPYAVVQLRKETLLDDMYNIVGFQTNLTFGEQKRVFSLIPALKNAEFSRFGVMHRNSYINAPIVLNRFYQLKQFPKVFIAGQLSGVEGYVESISSGLVCAIEMDRLIRGLDLIDFTNNTMIGALANYLESASPSNFQPMGANMGLLKPLDTIIKDKQLRYTKLAENSIKYLKQLDLR